MTLNMNITQSLIQKLPIPDSIPIRALLETILILIVILAAGFLIGSLNNCLRNFLAVMFGATPAFLIGNYLTYPGTVLHELSHAIVALATGAKVKKINLFPKGQTLGSVELELRGNIILRSLQSSLTAIAPVCFGALSLALMWRLILPNLTTPWHYILFWYLFASILFHMTMSPADYKSFFKGLIPSMVLMFLIFLIFGAFGIYF